MLLAEFRRQLGEGMWAAVPITDRRTGRREALLVTEFGDIPEDAERRSLDLLRSVVNPQEWEMTLRADEDRLLAFANVGGTSCQVPLTRIARDLQRLARWRGLRA